MELRTNVSLDGKHYFYAIVSGTFYSEKKVYEKMVRDYPESEGFKVSISRSYIASKKISESDLSD